MASFSSINRLGQSAPPPPQSSRGVTHDAALRREFRREIEALQSHFATIFLKDQLSLDLHAWHANFIEAYRISPNFKEMLHKHIGQLRLLLRDAFGVPLTRGALIYSDNRLYDSRSIELHQLNPDLTKRSRSPLEPNNSVPFNAIGSHAHVEFLLTWMERLHLLEDEPEMDKLFDELRQQHANEPKTTKRVSDVAAKKMPKTVRLSDLRRHDEGEPPAKLNQTQGGTRPRVMTLEMLRQRDAQEAQAGSRPPVPEREQPLPAQAPVQNPLPPPNVEQEHIPRVDPVEIQAPAPEAAPNPAQQPAPNLASRAERIARLRANVLQRQAEEAAAKAKAEEAEAKQDAFMNNLGETVGQIRSQTIEGFAKIDAEGAAFLDEGLARLAQLEIIDQGQWDDLENMQRANQTRINDLETRNNVLDGNINELQSGIGRVNEQNRKTELLNAHLEKRVNQLEIDARKRKKSTWSSIWPVLGVLGACALTTFVLSAAIASAGSAASASFTLNKGFWVSVSVPV